ncbi:MAG TPA: hypothetical protein PLN30_12305 [Ferruginibacter sp.]|nr:hypothetical protein [Ferruginibacter sp.]
MLKFNELREGNYVFAENEGDSRRGEITELNTDDKQVCVDNGIQDFWYEPNQLSPVPITEEELAGFKFKKEKMDDGSIKYSKGAFRMMIPKEGDFSAFELWYKDEKRHVPYNMAVHILQNHFYEMTKMYLNDEVFG